MKIDRKIEFKKILRIGIIVLFAIFILGYSFFQSKELIFGADIQNVNIENGMTISENPLLIKGNTKNAIFTSLNDKEIYIDKEGNFSEYVVLLNGYNAIKINTRDKFGNEDEKNYKLMMRSR